MRLRVLGFLALLGVAIGVWLLRGPVGSPPSPSPAFSTRTALVPGSGLEGFDQRNVASGDLRLDPTVRRAGTPAARATVESRGNGYSRGVFNVRWNAGDDVRFGGDFRLARGFGAALQGQVDLLRWDDFPDDARATDRSGIVVFSGDGLAHLVRQRLGQEEVELGAPFRLPEDRWFRLEVRQHLASRAGAARNDVYVDGRLRSTTREPNSYGRPVRRVRIGLVAIDAARQRRALRLWFARATVGSGVAADR